MNTLGWLWRNRVQPPLTSVAFFRRWAKRICTLPSLLASCARLSRLQRGGAELGSPLFIAPIRLNGPAARLRIGAGTFVGRCDIDLHAVVDLGRCVILNDDVRILTGSHNVHDPNFGLVARPVEIGDYAWVCTGAILLPGVKIGRGAVIGAGAVVTRDVADYVVVAGNPAEPTGSERVRELCYAPVRLVAAFEAWLGRPDRCSTELRSEIATLP